MCQSLNTHVSLRQIAFICISAVQLQNAITLSVTRVYVTQPRRHVLVLQCLTWNLHSELVTVNKQRSDLPIIGYDVIHTTSEV